MPARKPARPLGQASPRAAGPDEETSVANCGPLLPDSCPAPLPAPRRAAAPKTKWAGRFCHGQADQNGKATIGG